LNLNRKLAQWQAAGLLSAEAAQRIAAYEADQARPLVLLAGVSLGATTVSLGIISVVASNWEGIAYPMKLGVDVLLMLGLGCGILWADGSLGGERAPRPLLREVLVVVYYALALASVALLGQIYQLGSPVWVALLTWTGMTLPLMGLSRTRWAAMLWVAGVSATYLVCSTDWLEELGSHRLRDNLLPVVLTVLPVSLVAGGHIPAFLQRRRNVARTFSATGWTVLVGACLLVPLVFYDDVGESSSLSFGPVVVGLVLGAFAWRMSHWLAAGRRAVAVTRTFLLMAWSCLVVGTVVSRGDWELVGALAQLLLMALLGWVFALQSWTRAFNLLTAAIAIRLLIIYFEVFGSLLGTGLGLIGGGVLTLVLSWLWRKKTAQLEAQLVGKRPSKPGADA
jgi:uncharacterized membrane protein